MRILYVGKHNRNFSYNLMHNLFRRGYQVEFCPIESTSCLYKICKTLKVGVVTKLFDYILLYRCKRLLTSHKFDRIFIHNVSNKYVNICELIRKHQAHAITVAYNWVPSYYQKFDKCQDYFDIIFSFDRKDVQEFPKLRYYPLYYDEVFLMNSSKLAMKKCYDIVYIGSSNSPGRMDLLDQLLKWNLKNSVSFFFYLYTPINVLLSWITSRKYTQLLKYCHPVQMSHIRSANIYSRANCVLDLLPLHQTGNTMRTYETLASGCKIITNNSMLETEPFYDENRVFIFKEITEIKTDFVKTRYDGQDCTVGQFMFSNWVSNTVLVDLNNDL